MSERNPLFTPPRFFEDVKFHRHTDRTIAWLELFYDLVYVATLIQIGNFLSDNVTWLGFGQFMVLIIVVWWAWTGETFYQNRFVVDDLLHRCLVFLQMFAIATIGLSVSGAFGELYVQFTVAYVITRLMLVFMYLRSANAHPESRQLSMGYIRGFSFGILVWIGSIFLPAEIHWVGWLVGIAIELATPLMPSMRRLQREVPVDPHHIAERFGIFTIIVLGESFVKVLDDAQGTPFGLNQMLFSISGLIVTYSLWWLYFSDTTDAIIDFTGQWKPLAWSYGHLPLAAGLVAFGVGAKKLFASTIDYPNEPLEPKYRLLYTAAMVLFLLSVAIVDYSTVDERLGRIWLRVISAGLILLAGLFAVGLNSIAFVTIVSVIMLVQVIYSIYIENRKHTTA